MMPLIEADSLTLEELQEFHGLIDEFGKSHRSVETMQSSFLASMSGHAAA
jgi:endonuclease-3 related protein